MMTSTAEPSAPDLPALPAAPPRPSAWAHSVIAAALATAAVSVILLAFAWPGITASAKDLPVAVVGNPATAVQLTAQAPPGLFDVQPAGDRAAAVMKIERREVYGAIVIGPSSEVLVSSAASPAAAQLLMRIGSSIPNATVTDVVPFAADDPNGAGLAIAGLPLALGGVLGGVLISMLVTGARRRLAAIAAYAVLGGLALAGILQPWLGVLHGDFWVNALAIGLGITATAALITGLDGVIGRAGIALGAVLTVLIGNPLSGQSMPKEFLLEPWGAVGQWLVPGASGTLLRNLSYFPDADAAFAWVILAGWLALGVLLILLSALRGRRANPG